MIGDAKEQNQESMKSNHLKWLSTAGGVFPHDALDTLTHLLGGTFGMNVAEKTGDTIPKSGDVPMFDTPSERFKI